MREQHTLSATAAGPLPPGRARARTPTLLEWLAVACFFVLCGLLSLRVAQTVQEGLGVWVAVAAVAGYVAADGFSGLVHWAFDTWGARTTPVLGPTFIIPFRIHHDDPEDITRHGFVATNGHNCLASLPVLAAGLLLPGTWSGTAPTLALVLALCLGVFATNQFHKWAHADTVGPVVGWLQRHHVILNPAHHAVHHTAPFHRHYCITTGWLNGPLDALGVFRGLERLISALTGARPRRDDLAGRHG